MSQASKLQKRNSGSQIFTSRYENTNDDYGFDLKTFSKWELISRFLFEDYFKVQAYGIENIPAEGKAILVANHTGGLPIDALMIYEALFCLHPAPRRIRFLALHRLFDVPIVQEIVKGFGGVPAEFKYAKKLLEQDELVFFFPEGARGLGKLFSMRYRLCDFDPGFVKAAIETGAPIIPITMVGGDEIYPMLANLKSISRLMRAPYWPVTPTFPWLPFSASCLPLPIRLLIKVGQPIYLKYPPQRASDRKLRLRIARAVQYNIQKELNTLLNCGNRLFTSGTSRL